MILSIMILSNKKSQWFTGAMFRSCRLPRVAIDFCSTFILKSCGSQIVGQHSLAEWAHAKPKRLHLLKCIDPKTRNIYCMYIYIYTYLTHKHIYIYIWPTLMCSQHFTTTLVINQGLLANSVLGKFSSMFFSHLNSTVFRHVWLWPGSIPCYLKTYLHEIPICIYNIHEVTMNFLLKK